MSRPFAAAVLLMTVTLSTGVADHDDRIKIVGFPAVSEPVATLASIRFDREFGDSC